MSCPTCGGYMRKVPTIDVRNRKDLDDERDYYRCDDCDKIQSREEYMQDSRTEASRTVSIEG